MEHCFYCEKEESGYIDSHWETHNGSPICRDCLEEKAIQLLQKYDGKYVAPKIRKLSIPQIMNIDHKKHTPLPPKQKRF